MTALRSDATTLGAVTTLLGPGPAGGAPAPNRPYRVLPNGRRPRYVVPADRHHARGAHLRPGGGAAQAAVRTGLRLAFRVGAGRLVGDRLDVADGDAEHPGLRRHLAGLLDDPGLDVVVALGAPRPNRKPVLQVVAADGATLAWAKLGVDAHTDALVAHEAEALAAVAGRGPTLVTPEVLAADTWQGHPLLVLAHLPRRESAGELRLTAAAVRAIAGPPVEAEVTTGDWWRSLETGFDPDGVVAAHLGALRPAVEGRRWPFGRWHGDMAPWNAAWDGESLVAWDWERSDAVVPLGLDLVHNRLQLAVLRHGRPVGAALTEAVEAERPTLVELGYAADDVPLLARAYAATLRARHAEDARHGPRGGSAAIATGLDAALLGEEVTTP